MASVSEGWTCSERELDSELQLAHRRSRGVDAAVRRARHVRVRVAPDRLVECVERLQTQLQAAASAENDVPDERQVRREDPGPRMMLRPAFP